MQGLSEKIKKELRENKNYYSILALIAIFSAVVYIALLLDRQPFGRVIGQQGAQHICYYSP